jgi:putative NIF3 family GTP cyclohydrolase 1 type 2
LGQAVEITNIAVMGAMNENLIMVAAQRGVQLYLTGQFRKTAAKAVEQTGLHVLATGHQQSERFGLQLLAEFLQERWPALTTLIFHA